jgi:hypothetical protein
MSLFPELNGLSGLAVEHHREECKGATLFLAHHSTHSPTPQLRAHHSVVRPPARALWAAGTTAVSTSVTASHRNMVALLAKSSLADCQNGSP